MIAVHADIYIYIYMCVFLFLYPDLPVPYIFGTKTLVPNIYGTGRSEGFLLISKVLGQKKQQKNDAISSIGTKMVLPLRFLILLKKLGARNNI